MGDVLSAIWLILSNAPSILGIVSSIVQLIGKLSPSQQTPVVKALNAGYSHALDNAGDRSKLDPAHTALLGGPSEPVGLG